MPFLTDPIKRALAAGATVVTPNRRLARGLVTLYDRDQHAVGHNAWPAATALPWDAWLQTLWNEALAAGVVPANTQLRTPAQTAYAWRRIVADHAEGLIDPRGAAALAAETWALVHAWGAGGESWRAWASDDDTGDPAAFARWANRYARELTEAGAIDPAELPDRIVAWASRMPALRGAAFTFAAFSEFAPQQERLLAAIAAAGASVVHEDTLPVASAPILCARGATPRDEIARALTWARTRVRVHPDASIAIAVEDLSTRRDEIRALAEDILCPALQWPGREGEARPYNLSLGTALSEVPLVAAALDLLEWAEMPLPLGRAAALMRSPWLPGESNAWMRRAKLEADWLTLGRRTLSIRAAIAALRVDDRALAERWAAVVDGTRAPSPASASPRQHADAWRAWLAATGWPGERALDSATYQARDAFDRALADFAALGAVAARLSRGEALAALRAQLAGVVFQPESPPAPIQIVGFLEAAGQPFDALWVAGLVAERWPRAPQPNPLLPVHWQRERNLPRATAARELKYATLLAEQFARAAPEVVFSHAEREDDHPCTPSSLIFEGNPASLPDVASSTARTQYSMRAPPECIDDATAPPLPAGSSVRGGARVVEAQSDCPFKSTSIARLGVETWPQPIVALSASERGTLVHAALAAFWRNVKTHAALAAMSPPALGAAIKAAVKEAGGAITPIRWRAVMPLVAAGEAARLESLLGEWIDRFERTRPPFTASDMEKELPLSLAGLSFRLKLDRIDALGDGGVAILDYKTGRAGSGNTWFDERPQAPQLALYALAYAAAHPDRDTRAIVYAQLKPGELGLRGLAADPSAWPPIPLASEKDPSIADWTAAQARWTQTLGALASELAAGVSTVSPRNRKTTCARCRRQPLCRVGALALEDREDQGDE
jgi:probable DNA repair protein